MQKNKHYYVNDIDALYTDYHNWLYNRLSAKLGCACLAQDLAHDTFVKILCRPEQQGLYRPRAYLSKIAHGIMVDHIRRKELERALLDAIRHLPEPEGISPESRLVLLEALIRADAMLDGLTPKVRTAYLMSRLEGLSYAEIAQKLRVSLSSVEKYISTALRHCYRMRQIVV